jgi:outer membrane protein OmpA-like peptidoglycan-associated protein
MTKRSPVPPALLGWLVATGITTAATTSFGQAPPPPIPPPAFDDEGEDAPEEEAADTSASSEEASPVEEESAPPPPPPAEEPAPAQEPWEAPVAAEVGAAKEDDAAPKPDAYFRTSALRRMTTLSGSTGLQRVSEASSGAPGTFRMNLVGSYFARNNFLCTSSAPCSDPVTRERVGGDEARHSDAILMISATPLPFLEAFFSIHNSATRNSNGVPELLEVVGDTQMGLKGFLPEKPDQIFGFGGETNLHLVMGTGGVGPVGGATSVAFRGLASLNLDNRTKEEDRIPLRLHLNLGYKIDNSAIVVRDLEQTERPEGRGEPIERTERYGLGISRVDAFQLGLGAEYVNPYVRPFFEWTMDVPVNRQAYVCNIQSAELRGDECLGVAAGFATSPSRMTLGARGYPWQTSGLALNLALDIGTSGTKRFLEETVPEAPYTLWFGLGYAVDTVPPPPTTIEVPAEAVGGAPELRRYIAGAVVESKAGAAVPDAIIRYDGVPMTGLVANADGQFISQDLPPGQYSFKVFAEQFREGTCSVTIPDAVESATMSGAAAAPAPDAPPLGGGEEGGTALADQSGAPSDAPYLEDPYTMLVPLRCELEELPQVADITGLLVDAVSGGPVADAKVRITDKLNRSLELNVDSTGSFQFRNVPFGAARLTVSAPGYLTTVSPISIESRENLKPHVLLNPRPAKLAVTFARKAITLGQPIEFVSGQPEVTVDSMVIIEQLAAALLENSELEGIEIQVHTDDSGSPSYSRRLSQQRADAVVELLVQLGVPQRRLRGKGYGPDQPLAPNVSDANRARNNRVQIVID